MTKNKFLKNSLLFSAGNFNVILLNYLMIAFMARGLSELEFGQANTLLAIFRYLLTFGMAFYLAVSHKVANQKSGESIHWFKSLEKLLLWIGGGVFIAFIVFENQLQSYFHIEKPFIFSLLGLVFTVAFLLPLSRGYLAGKKSFKHVTLNSNLEAGLKILVFSVFLLMGMPFYGLLIALTLSILISHLSNRRRINRESEVAIRSESSLPKKQMKGFIKHIFQISLATGLVTAFYSLDIMFMQHLNPELNAGYVILNKMAQVIFLVTNSLIVVMFPEVRKNGGKEMGQKIYTTLGLTLAISLLALIGYSLFGRLGIRILFGETYVDWANYLPYTVGIGLCLSLINLATHYYLGKKQNHAYLAILSLGLASMCVSIFYLNSSIELILSSVLISLSATAIMITAKMVLDIRSEKSIIQEKLLLTLPQMQPNEERVD